MHATAANSPSMAQWRLTRTSCSGIAVYQTEHQELLNSKHIIYEFDRMVRYILLNWCARVFASVKTHVVGAGREKQA